MAKIFNLLSNAGGSSTTNFPLLEVKNTAADEYSGEIKFLKDGATSAANDQLGLISFYGENNAGTPESILFSKITAKPANIDDAEEHGKLEFDVAAAGVSTNGLKIEGDSTTDPGTGAVTKIVNITAIDGGVGTFAIDDNFTVNAASGNTAVAGTLNVDGISTLGATTGATVSTAGIVNVNNVTDASSATTGALIVDGGVGIAKKCYVAGDFSIATNKFTVASTNGNTAVAGTLDVSGDTSVSTFDSTGATSLATSGGAVNISKSGVMTTVKGTLNVDEAVTLDGALDVTGDTSVSTFDSTGATSLATAGGAVNISSTGVMTTVKGTLNVDEAVTFDGTLNVTGNTGIDGDFDVATNKFTVASGTGNTVVAGTLEVGSNATITGNLIVSGTTTTVNSNTVNIGDNIIVLNSDETGTPSQDGGIEIERGISANARFVWDEGIDKWSTSNASLTTGTGNATVGGVGTFTAQSVHSGGIQTGGTIISDTDSTDNLGSSAIRWANVYADSLGDSGQALAVAATTVNLAAGTLSFDGSHTIDTSGDYALNISSGTATTTLTAGTVAMGTNATVGGTLGVGGAVSFNTSGSSYTFPSSRGTESQIFRMSASAGVVGWSNLLLDDLGDVQYDGAGSAGASLYVGSEPSDADGDAQFNVALGFEALNAINGTATNNEGDMNTCIGYQAGNLITTGSNCTVIGYGANASAIDATNEITLGNPSVGAVRCAEASLITLSDGRDKKDVVNSTYGLDFVESLRPVQYTWDKRVLNEEDANFNKNGQKRIGFIAQELQNACGESGNEILDLVYESNPERLEVRYGNLIPILTKAIQELKSENNALSERLSALENAQ